jgi:hypothetical protein
MPQPNIVRLIHHRNVLNCRPAEVPVAQQPQANCFHYQVRRAGRISTETLHVT